MPPTLSPKATCSSETSCTQKLWERARLGPVIWDNPAGFVFKALTSPSTTPQEPPKAERRASVGIRVHTADCEPTLWAPAWAAQPANTITIQALFNMFFPSLKAG